MANHTTPDPSLDQLWTEMLGQVLRDGRFTGPQMVWGPGPEKSQARHVWEPRGTPSFAQRIDEELMGKAGLRVDPDGIVRPASTPNPADDIVLVKQADGTFAQPKAIAPSLHRKEAF